MDDERHAIEAKGPDGAPVEVDAIVRPGLSREEWIQRCSDQYRKRLKDCDYHEARRLAEANFNAYEDLVGEDPLAPGAEYTPEESADEDLDSWEP